MASSKEVLIVGAGPSGLMLAVLLARWKIPFRIIDKAKHKSPYSRAIAVQIRTLEIFSALGLLPKLLEKAQAVYGIEINAEGMAPIGIAPAATTSFFMWPMIIDQPHTEAVLENALRDLGHEVERGVELKDFALQSDGVNAEIAYENGEIKVKHYSYIIGADGAHSIVRKRMATSFIGTTYDDAFILADAQCFHDLNHHTFRLFFEGKDFLAMIPMQGAHHYRLISVRRNELKHEGPPPTIDEFRTLAKKLVPFNLEIKDAAWVSRFFVQCRSASHYQDGRIFLIGDAAHIHSPAGGQGMNTGLQDALNLSFKLAMVLKGLAPESLLLTYEQERRPVGEFLIENTDKLFRYMVGGSWPVRLFRLFVLPRLFRSAEVRSRLFRIGSQTAIRYDHGAVCHGLSHLAIAGIRVGVRIPNVTLIDSHLSKTDLHTLAMANFFTCFIFVPPNIDKLSGKMLRKNAKEFADRHPGTLQCKFVFASDYDAEKIMEELDYCLITDQHFLSDKREAFFMVVRNDCHVFCLGSIAEMPHADDALTKIIGLQVTR